MNLDIDPLPYWYNPLFLATWGSGVSLLFLVLFLIALSALISGSEVAYFSINENDLKKLKDERSPSSKRVISLLKKSKQLLATILVANNLINISIIVISDYLVSLAFPIERIDVWSSAIIQFFNNHYLSTQVITSIIHYSITVVAVTFILLLFGEVTPKVYARTNKLGLAKFMSRNLFFQLKLFSPLTSLMVKGTVVLEKRIGKTSGFNNVTSEEIEEAINLVVKDNINENNTKTEIELLNSIVQFGETTAKQILTPWVDIISLDINSEFSKVFSTIRKHGFSRIPVYENDRDHIIGLLYVKDLIEFINEKEFNWQSYIRKEILFIPETKKIDDLLKQFQKEKIHIAISVDEFGSVTGLITLEDIVEEIVGEIKDEFDSNNISFKKIDNFNFLFEGKTHLKDVCRVLKLDTETFNEFKGDSDSIAGLVLEYIGFFPKVGRKIKIINFDFEVMETDKRRIRQLKITLPNEN